MRVWRANLKDGWPFRRKDSVLLARLLSMSTQLPFISRAIFFQASP